jgi:hypothetical protein
MEESTITVPSWLPWATTAVLAAIVACVGEMWMVEKSRSQLLRDEIALSASALKSAQNQLEAEQILSKRELGSDFVVELLAPPKGIPSRACGAVVWNPTSPKGVVTLFNMPKRPSGGDYQLWMIDAGPELKPGVRDFRSYQRPRSCAVFERPDLSGSFQANVDGIEFRSSGLRFVLFYGKKGGEDTLSEAKAAGSIVLASPRWDGRIPNP